MVPQGEIAVAEDGTADEAAARAPQLGSVDRALRLLSLLGEEQVLTVSSAAEKLGVARSTAHRLLQVLQQHGFALQNSASRAYGPGSALLRLGLTAVDRLELRTVARPEIEALAAETGETVHLITREEATTFVLDSVESSQAVRVSGRIGGSLPANLTAAGKVMLSRLPAQEVIRLLGPDPLSTRTPGSIQTHAQLARELDVIRERGWGTNLAENEPDLAAVAVAIRGVHGVRPAALSVAAPLVRVDDERLAEMAAMAARCAERIALRLERR
jgi:IclR family acetate operon transcriptional repressor